MNTILGWTKLLLILADNYDNLCDLTFLMPHKKPCGGELNDVQVGWLFLRHLLLNQQ
jgi:hypothetical protein